ncbi:MAG: hypothetical protein ACI9YE_000618 [Psychroserpens sp.]|jgi:hypothetical protein
MNSYNENLHSSVVSSLNAQELELQKLKSEVDASTFSMYYAQGARITAEEKLGLTTNKYKFQQKVNTKAITDSDLSTNVLTSAKNVKSHVTKSISNTAVAAANVQIAANAILKLASDTGSIFSIVNAADFGTDIYNQSKTAYDLMNITAYDAEKASQDSMEASSLTAEISAVTLSDKATVADTSVKQLLTVVSTQLNAVTAELVTETNNVATTNTTEKKTEGDLEDLNAAYHASKTAYGLTNKELNLDLTVVLPESDESFIGDETNYTVSFFPMNAPFKNIVPSKSEGTAPTYKQYNPVENYYIMLVKAGKKDTFAISEAETLVTKDDATQYIKIPQQEFNEISKAEFVAAYKKVFYDNPTITFEQIPTQKLEKIIIYLSKIKQTIFTSELLDTDGDKMSLGKDYTIFVYAELRTSYKKIINTFDNYLSAASEKFALTNQLNAPEAATIIVSPNGTPTVAKNAVTNDQTLAFTIWEDPDYKVAYRCMFLPHTLHLIKGLLTTEGLEAIESETEGLEKIADKYDPKIASTSSKISSMQAERSGIDSQLVEKNKKLKATQKKLKAAPSNESLKTEITTLEGEINALITSKNALTAQLEKQEKILKIYNAVKKKAIEGLEADKTQLKPGFYFDLLTAEQVPAVSYTTADEVKGSMLNKLSKDILTIIADMKKLDYDIKVFEANLKLLEIIFNTIKGDLFPDGPDAIKKEKDIQKSKDDIKSFLDGIKNYSSVELTSLNTNLTSIGGEDIIQKLITDFGNLITDLKTFLDDLSSVDSLLLFLEDIFILLDGFDYLLQGYACTLKQMTIKPETTDNFGNRLIHGKTYVPAVLSNTNATSVEENTQFSNALSDFQNTAEFKYATTNFIDLINFNTLAL